MTSVGEDFDSPVDRMTVLWIAVDLFFQLSLSLPNGLMNQVAMVAGMGFMPEFRADLSHCCVEWINMPAVESDTVTPFPGVISLSLAGRLITLDHLHCRKGSTLSIWEYSFWVWICLSST